MKAADSYVVCGLTRLTGRTGYADTAECLIYEITRILLLFVVIILDASIIRSYFPLEGTESLSSHKKPFIDNIITGSLEIAAPSCSHSAGYLHNAVL